MIARIKAAVARFARKPVVQSAARHAATAFVGVVVAAVVAGGFPAITVGVVVAAAAAALRVLQIALVAYFAGP